MGAGCPSSFVGRSGLPSNPSPSNGEQVPDLNDRQRAYLLAIFETDQELSRAISRLSVLFTFWACPRRSS
jgi:hypothetical protein